MASKSTSGRTGKGSEEPRTNDASTVIRLGSRFGVDVALLATAFLMLATDMTVLFFHLIFFWLAVGAFSWQFRAFVLRAVVWVTVASTEVLLTVLAGGTQPEELIELPLLTSFLVLIFMIARRRAAAQAQLLEHQAMHDALTIAVMLLTIAIGAVYALRYANVSRVMLGVIAVYGFGVTLANLWNILVSKPVSPSYIAAFGIMFLVSATLLIAERQNTVERSGTT